MTPHASWGEPPEQVASTLLANAGQVPELLEIGDAKAP
jgi:hypothetical protein